MGCTLKAAAHSGYRPFASVQILRHCRRIQKVKAHIPELTVTGTSAKNHLLGELADVVDYGLYGVKAAKLRQIKDSIQDLERVNPLQQPTADLELLSGTWQVIFSTIKITGWRRVTLGLRDLVQIDGLTQEVETSSKSATNRVAFSVPAFGVKGGELVLKAAYEVENSERVTIKLTEATLVPQKLQKVFESNFDLLLSVFNPEGHLDITYCDQDLRCGRDDKGNIFVLQRQN